MRRTVVAHADNVDPVQAEADAMAKLAEAWGDHPFSVWAVDLRLLSRGPWRATVDSFHEDDEA